MATKLEAGQLYKAAQVRSGESSKGPWMLTGVVDERGKNEITLFIRNTDCNLRDGQQFKIKELCSITLGVRKSKKDDKWFPSYSAEAIIEPIASEFEDLDGMEDESDPWASLSPSEIFENREDDLPL